MMILQSELQELADTIHVLNESVGRGSILSFGGGGINVFDNGGELLGTLSCDTDEGWYFDTDTST